MGRFATRRFATRKYWRALIIIINILINALRHFLVANLLVANLPKSQNNKKLGLPQEVCHKVCHNGWGFATKAFFEFRKISSSILRTRFVDI